MQSENAETTLSGGKKIDRRKRIERLKKMILFGVASAIITPTILCVLLGIQLGRVSKELKLLKEQNAIINTNTEEMLNIPADANKQPSEQAEDDKSHATDATSSAPDTRKVYLTFDDGPSIYTEEILDILEKYEVRRCFYGHLHGGSHKLAMEGQWDGVEFRLVAADYIGFKPFRVL